MSSQDPLPKWASKPCVMGIDEAGRGPCFRFSIFLFVFFHFCIFNTASIILFRVKINLNEIVSRCTLLMGWLQGVLGVGVLLTEVYVDTVGDPEKYRIKLSEKFPNVKFVVAKKADSLYPVVSGASIVAKVTRDRVLRDWALEETAENMHRNFGSGYPGDPTTKCWLEDHKHSVFGFPTLVRFSWGTCTSYFKDIVEVSCSLSPIGLDSNLTGKNPDI
ncbi:Ribonuclease H2 subunit A, partial [Cucurbita argyrosperma subsp. argyrosperma]